MKKSRALLSSLAIVLLVVVFGAALVGFFLLTENRVDENRQLAGEAFQDYGEPIETWAIDNLGTPTKIVVTSSTIETSRWSRISFFISEYAEAAGGVVSDLFRPDLNEERILPRFFPKILF